MEEGELWVEMRIGSQSEECMIYSNKAKSTSSAKPAATTPHLPPTQIQHGGDMEEPRRLLLQHLYLGGGASLPSSDPGHIGLPSRFPIRLGSLQAVTCRQDSAAHDDDVRSFVSNDLMWGLILLAQIVSCDRTEDTNDKRHPSRIAKSRLLPAALHHTPKGREQTALVL